MGQRQQSWLQHHSGRQPLELSTFSSPLSGGQLGGGEKKQGWLVWNFSWRLGICGQIAFWASNFPAIEILQKHLSLFACISLCWRLKGFFHLLLYIHLKWLLQYLIFIRTWKPGIYFAGQLLIHFPWGLWQAAGESDAPGGAAIHISPGDRRTNQSTAGYQWEDKSGKGLMSNCGCSKRGLSGVSRPSGCAVGLFWGLEWEDTWLVWVGFFQDEVRGTKV